MVVCVAGWPFVLAVVLLVLGAAAVGGDPEHVQSLVTQDLFQESSDVTQATKIEQAVCNLLASGDSSSVPEQDLTEKLARAVSTRDFRIIPPLADILKIVDNIETLLSQFDLSDDAWSVIVGNLTRLILLIPDDDHIHCHLMRLLLKKAGPRDPIEVFIAVLKAIGDILPVHSRSWRCIFQMVFKMSMEEIPHRTLYCQGKLGPILLRIATAAEASVEPSSFHCHQNPILFLQFIHWISKYAQLAPVPAILTEIEKKLAIFFFPNLSDRVEILQFIEHIFALSDEWRPDSSNISDIVRYLVDTVQDDSDRRLVEQHLTNYATMKSTDSSMMNLINTLLNFGFRLDVQNEGQHTYLRRNKGRLVPSGVPSQSCSDEN